MRCRRGGRHPHGLTPPAGPSWPRLMVGRRVILRPRGAASAAKCGGAERAGPGLARCAGRGAALGHRRTCARARSSAWPASQAAARRAAGAARRAAALQSGEIRLAADGGALRASGRWIPGRLRQLGVAHVPGGPPPPGHGCRFAALGVSRARLQDDAAIARGPALLSLLDRRAMRAQCAGMMADFDVRPPDPGLALGEVLRRQPAEALVIARASCAARRACC